MLLFKYNVSSFDVVFQVKELIVNKEPGLLDNFLDVSNLQFFNIL